MTENEREIWLLENRPEELLELYQDLILLIVRKYRRLGYVASREADDLVQDVNHKLLGRIKRIQEQYNGQSMLRTYFSVIVRNICREEFRRNPKVEEPQAPEYYKLEKAEIPIDNILITQEYERFEKVLKLLMKDRIRFIIMFKYMMSLNISKDMILELYPDIKMDNLDIVLDKLNDSDGINKKERFENLSQVLQILENNTTSADSLRKWYTTRTIECLGLMNGNPPRSAHSPESLQILIEKYEDLKK